MSKLTKSYIEKLPKQDPRKQKLYWDSEQRGLGLRVTSGSRSFIFQQRVNGRTARVTIGAWPDMTVDDARVRARRLAVNVDDGFDPRQEAKLLSDSKVTLLVAFNRFISERPLKERTKRDYKYYLDRHFDDWKCKQLGTISSDMVVARYRKTVEVAGAAQGSVAMRFLRSLMNFAKATYGGVALSENPVTALTARRAWIRSNARTDHLRQHEIRPFVDALRKLDNPTMAAYIEFILLTGARRSEAALVKWKDVDSKAKALTFRDTKNHTDRVLPITPRIAVMLEILKKGRMGDYVFSTVGRAGKPSHITEPRKALAKANSAAGSAVTVHGLRRTYATVLESLDCPAYPLKALLGHSMKSDVTTAHYTQITVERVRPWAEKYESYILKLVDGTADNNIIPLNKRQVK